MFCMCGCECVYMCTRARVMCVCMNATTFISFSVLLEFNDGTLCIFSEDGLYSKQQPKLIQNEQTI